MNAELSDFLRTRRAKLNPEDVGISRRGATRRRVPGLRREEVAELAGVSTDYYIRLEQGRARQVSDSVLDAVARTLRLQPAEHAYLYDLMRPRAASEPIKPVRDGLRLLLDGMRDVPAMVVDYRMVILSTNRLGAAVFGVTDDPRTRDRGRLFFLDPQAREFFPDWAADADSMVAELRLQAARHPDDPWLTRLIGELAIKSTEFRTRWADHDVREKTSGIKRLRHPVVGDLELRYERLNPADDPDHRLLAYTAEPGSASAERLSVLASWTADGADTPKDERAAAN
jgi:transcriptional regulator with XRE-family HTH domain